MRSVASTHRILVFDSGVGGLSVLEAIRAAIPGISVLYVADSAFYPYGPKPEAELIARVPVLLAGLCAEHRPDLVVIACNTASTVVLPATRTALSVPVVGCVPAIKPAARLSKTRCIGLLGTPGTVRRHYTDALIRDFAADCQVVRHGSADLVDLAERKLAGETVSVAAVAATIAPLFEGPVLPDVVVLACTHFPLLRDDLKAAAPVPVAWVDSGEAIARRVATLLASVPRRTAPPPDRAFVTAPEGLARLGACLRARGLAPIEAGATLRLSASA